MLVKGFDVVLGKANASKEITELVIDGNKLEKPTMAPAEVLEWFRTQPRVSIRTNGSPRIVFDGQEAQLGYWAANEEEREIYKAYREAHSGRSGAPRAKGANSEVREALVAFSETLKGTVKTEFEEILNRYFPDPKIEQTKKMLDKLDKETLALIKSLL